MHNKQSLKYVFIPAIWSCLELSWIFGSVHCWKMGSQAPTSRSSCQSPIRTDLLLHDYLFLCGSLKWTQPYQELKCARQSQPEQLVATSPSSVLPLSLKKQTSETCAIGQGRQSGWGVPSHLSLNLVPVWNVHGKRFKDMSLFCLPNSLLLTFLISELCAITVVIKCKHLKCFLWYHCDEERLMLTFFSFAINKRRY